MTLLQFLNQFVGWESPLFVIYRKRIVDGKVMYDDFPPMSFCDLCGNNELASKLLNSKVTGIDADCEFNGELGLFSFVTINVEE